jgi:2-amino-4-hydroxy-6-hydroxymethyldihydropteridine diphosphokinase
MDSAAAAGVRRRLDFYILIPAALQLGIKKMAIVAYIALGANLGDRTGNLRAAVEKLANTPGLKVTKVSAMMENPAVGGPPDSPPFLNAAAEVETTLQAGELLKRLLDIEKEIGRVRRDKWGPRLIDLDLLLYGDAVFQSAEMSIPHPLMHQRSFVLKPMAEIAPDVMHPIRRRSMSQLLAELRSP